MEKQHRWLEWAQKMDLLAQAGLTYSTNPFDLERYHQLRQLSAEIFSTYAGIEFHEIHSLLDAQAGYTTPKVDVRGVVFKEGKILLVKELSDGGWTLPGGWVDVNEPPSRAVEREVWEESGYQVQARRLMAIYDRNQHGFPAYIFHIWKVYLECELTGGGPTNSIETGGAEWFARGQYPPLSIQRTTAEVLDRLFELHQNPQLPAEYD